jgi:hypothetical protein
MRLRRLLALGTLVLCAAPLAACRSGHAADAGTPGATAHGRDACLLGTWSVDLPDLANATAAKLPGGGTGTSSGSITVTFGDTMKLDYDATLTVTSKSSNGLDVGVQDVYSGTATSTDYQADGGKLTGTMATNTVTLKLAVIVGTHTQPASTAPLSGVLDLSQGNTTYACGGSNLTLTTSGTVWHLTKA